VTPEASPHLYHQIVRPNRHPSVGKITAIHCSPRTQHRPPEPCSLIHNLDPLLLPLALWISKSNNGGKRCCCRRGTRTCLLAILNSDQMLSIQAMGTGKSISRKSFQRMPGCELQSIHYHKMHTPRVVTIYNQQRM
jgi:hypothetical protein